MPRTYLVFGEMLWVMVARYFDEVLVVPIDIETVDTALHRLLLRLRINVSYQFNDNVKFICRTPS